MGSTSQPRPLDDHHKATTTTTNNNHHVGAPALSKMIRQDLIMLKQAMAEFQKKIDHMNVQIDEVCGRFEWLETSRGYETELESSSSSSRGGNETGRELGELKNEVKKLKSLFPSNLVFVNPAKLGTRGGNETERELGELKNEVKKLKSQFPSKFILVNPAEFGTGGGKETERELGNLRNEVKKLKSQIPSTLIKVNPADSQPRRNPWFDSSINHNSSEDYVSTAGKELYSMHKNPKFEHNTAFQQFEVSFLDLSFSLRDCLLCFWRLSRMFIIKKKFIIYWWIGEGFLPPNPEDQKTKDEIALGKTEEDFGNEILGEFIAKDFIVPLYQNCSLVTNSYRMLPFIYSALTIMAERSGFSPVYTLGPDTPTLAQYNEYQCLLNVGAAIIDGGPKLFSKMNHFKILYLGRWQRSVTHHIEVADAKILHGLKNMNQLRFLSLRGISLIVELPQFISRLTSLKILDLKACHNLEVVPDGIGLLKNLTHLDMSECYLVEHMPKGIGSLSQLQVLKGFIIGHSTDKKSCTIDDLTKLTKLRKLSICMSTTTEFSTSKQLGLEELKTLQKLKISWPGYNLQGETDDTLEQERAQSQPYAMLKRSSAFNERHLEEPIMKLPFSLQKLKVVCFPKKTTYRQLMFANLKNLKKLCIIGGPLRYLGPSEGTTVEILILKYLSEFEMHWSDLRKLLPNLIHVEKVECPRLTDFPCDKIGVWTRRKNDATNLH